jgi:hypothetical protein
VQVDAEIDVRTDRIAHRRDALDHGAQLGAIDSVVDRVELRRVAQIVDVEFQCGEAFRHHAARARCTALRRSRCLIAVAAIGIEPYAVAELAPEHAVERLAGGFRRHVPQSHFEPGQGDEKDAGLRAGKHMIAADLVPTVFDVARILADEFRLQLRDQSDDCRRTCVGIGFPIAGDAGVRIDTDQGRLAVVRDHRRLDIHDLHRILLPVTAPRLQRRFSVKSKLV